MDRIAFVVSGTEVNILINGRDLIEMVREVEMPFAQAEGHPSIAGGYMGLPTKVALLPSKQLLGEPKENYAGEDGETCLLVCGACGESGCWPLEAKVTVKDSEIVWSDFSQPFRSKDSVSGEWKYDNFGPFHFDRELYEKALHSEA